MSARVSRGRFETFNVARENLINSRRLRNRNRRKSHLDQTWESNIKIAKYHSPTDFYLWDCVKEIACRIKTFKKQYHSLVEKEIQNTYN